MISAIIYYLLQTQLAMLVHLHTTPNGEVSMIIRLQNSLQQLECAYSRPWVKHSDFNRNV